MARRRVFKTKVECRGISSAERRTVIGLPVGFQKAPVGSDVYVILGPATVGQLDAAVGPQVATAIDRGQSFTAVIQNAYQVQPSANAPTWIDIRVEYLLEQGQPSIQIPRPSFAPVAQEASKGEWKKRYTRVAGITYTNADGSDRQYLASRCTVGDPMFFEREPDNPHDRYAVKAVGLDGRQLGYLPSPGAQTDSPWCIATGMDEGYRYFPKVSGVGQNDDGRWGISLQVTFWDGPIHSQPEIEPRPHAMAAQSGRSRRSHKSSTVSSRSGCLPLLLAGAVFLIFVLLRR